MKFHYEFDIQKLSAPIHHRHQLMLIGSCFTESMSEKLRTHKFSVMDNPGGILFNPVSVANAITSYIDYQPLNLSSVFKLNEAWHSWHHHSRMSGLTPEEAIHKINSASESAHIFLKQADYLFVTLGSAWVYTCTDKATEAKPGMVVANNHKAPADWFQKRLLSVEETLAVLDNVLHRLFLFNPKLQIIFTISPVRHLREGVIENNRSKAVLMQAVHHLVEKFDKLYYFPAYELVIDDLRDYRFYAEDLVHPNYHATQYVWGKFTEACMQEDTRKLMKQLSEIRLAFQHKPFNPNSTQHLKFLAASLEQVKKIQSQHPYLNLETEYKYFFRTSIV